MLDADDSPVYESVVDFAADSPQRGLLNPPRGDEGKVVRPRCAKCGSTVMRRGEMCCWRCRRQNGRAVTASVVATLLLAGCGPNCAGRGEPAADAFDALDRAFAAEASESGTDRAAGSRPGARRGELHGGRRRRRRDRFGQHRPCRCGCGGSVRRPRRQDRGAARRAGIDQAPGLSPSPLDPSVGRRAPVARIEPRVADRFWREGVWAGPTP